MKMSHVGILVGEMAKAVEFYTKALDLEIVMDKATLKRMSRQLGECVLLSLEPVSKGSILYTL